MAQILAIAYNTGTQIEGTLQYGVLAVSNSNRDYSNNYGGVTWWATPDLSQRYVICYPDPKGTHPTPIEGVTAYLGFWGSELKTDESFLFLVNNIPATVGIDDFTDVTTANNWLFDNGYWSSYPLDAGSPILAPRALELCDIYQSCNGDGSIILILDEDAVNYPVGKWFDGNCYYRTGQQTYSNDFTFLSGPSYTTCDRCNSDCLLGETISTVECTLVTRVSQVTRPADPTPTPTPTPTSPCFNPSVDIVSCELDSDVVESLYSVRLRACCKDYLNEPYYIITKNINFLGITPVEGFVIIYNGICYEILTATVINDSTNLYIEPNPVSTMIGGSSPCKTCTTYYAPCVSLVTPTPTPTPTENYRGELTLRLTSCCEDKSIIVSVLTVLPIIVGDVVVVNSECYRVVLVSPYISGVTIPIDSSNHYSSLVHSQPCLECERRVPCGPEKTKAVTPTPTPTPTGVAETRIFTGRACCGNPRFNLVNIILPEDYTLTPGIGFVYDGYCYEIISEYANAPLVTEVTTNDLKPIDCNSPNCCDVTPTPTPTSSQICINTCEDCGPDFYLGDDGICYGIEITDANPPVNPYELSPITYHTYSEYYTKIYSENFNQDGTGLDFDILTTHNIWKNTYSNNTDGPLNSSAIWVSGSSSEPTNVWLGFSVCIDITEEKTYYVGMAADNHFRMNVDDVEFVNTLLNPGAWTAQNMLSFKIWHVYPITLSAGTHKIEMFGMNLGGPAAFGCKVYDNTLDELINATSFNDLNILFNSRQDEIEIVQDLNGNSLIEGWTCGDGGVYNPCDNTCTYAVTCEIDPCLTPTPTPTPTTNTCIECKGLNITFVIDYTSDMGDLINTMKSNIGGFVDMLDSQTNFYNLGLNIFDESLSQYPNYLGSVVYLIQTLPSQKIVLENNGLYQFFTSIVERSQNNGSDFLSKFNYLNSLSMPLGDGNLDPDPVNDAVKYSQQVSFSGPLDNLNDYENFVVLVSNAMPGGNDEVYNSQDSSYSLGQIQTILNNNNTKLLFFTDNNYVYSNSPLVEVAENTGGQAFFTSDPITELKRYIDTLCCDLPTPTPTPTNTPTPTIPVTPTSTMTPTPSSTPGPLPPIDSNTQIRFWFDNSGSMDSVYNSVSYAVNNILSDCLLEYYNNNVSLYNQRVQVHDMCFNNNNCASGSLLTQWATQNGVPNYVLNMPLMENFLLCMSLPPTNGADKVINIVIQDEAYNQLHGETGWSIMDPRTSVYDTSLSFLKNKIDISNNTIFGGLIVIPGTDDGQFQFNMLTEVVFGGTIANYGQGQYAGVNGINGNYQAYLKRKTLWSNNNSTNSYVIAENVIDILNELGAGITQC